MDWTGVIIAYEEHLLYGKKMQLNLKGKDEENPKKTKDGRRREQDAAEKQAEMELRAEAMKAIIRYAVTELLQWTPQEAMDHMTTEILDKLKLRPLIKTYLSVECLPPDMDRNADLDYLMAFCFGIRYNSLRQLMRMKQRISTGVRKKYPKSLFYGQSGREKAAYLLNDYISTHMYLSSSDQLGELYARFADSAVMNKVFRRNDLYTACHTNYHDPLEFFHYSLRDEERDDFLYTFHQLHHVAEEVAVVHGIAVTLPVVTKAPGGGKKR